MALPDLPVEGQDPWYEDRTAWDLAVEAELEKFPRMGIVVPNGSTLSDLQTALNSAATFGTTVWASGTYTTSSTLTVAASCDLSNVQINYTGTGTAVLAGTTTGSIHRKTMHLPSVRNMNKVSNGWAAVAGSIGIDLVNLYTTNVSFPHIRNFEIGLRVYGMNNQGSSYLTITLGHLDNNKINQQVDAHDPSGGWANQVLFLGGRSSHDSNEGQNVAGTKHIHIKALNINADPNNNLWLNSSLESPGVVEWAIDAAGGSVNMWLNPRFEFTGGNAKVRWGARAVRNRIVGGNMTDNVEETRIVGQASNSIEGTSRERFRPQGATGGYVVESESSNNHPVFTVMRNGASAGGDNIATQYTAQFLSSGVFKSKQYIDAFDRVQLNSNTGSALFGNGTVAPVAGIQGLSNFLFFTAGATTVGPITDGGASLGGASDYRFEYIRARTAIRTGAMTTGSRPTAATAGPGAMIFDSTLGKPIWSTGSGWVDANGTAV